MSIKLSDHLNSDNIDLSKEQISEALLDYYATEIYNSVPKKKWEKYVQKNFKPNYWKAILNKLKELR